MTPHGVFEWFKTELLAHPQQSEGVVEQSNVGEGFVNQLSEGVGILKDVPCPLEAEGVGQAAEGLTDGEKSNIIADIHEEINKVWEARMSNNPITDSEADKRLVTIYDKYFQPSEPAALKDGEIEALFKAHSVWVSDCRNIKVVPFAGFTAALKEVYSLLTNHKS